MKESGAEAQVVSSRLTNETVVWATTSTEYSDSVLKNDASESFLLCKSKINDILRTLY